MSARESLLETLFGDEPELMEAGSQASTVQHLVLDGLLELRLGDNSAVAEVPRQDRQMKPLRR